MARKRKGLEKKLNFGTKYPDKTAKQIIDGGDYKYIEFLFDENICIFSVETYKYIEDYKLKNKK